MARLPCHRLQAWCDREFCLARCSRSPCLASTSSGSSRCSRRRLTVGIVVMPSHWPLLPCDAAVVWVCGHSLDGLQHHRGSPCPRVSGPCGVQGHTLGCDVRAGATGSLRGLGGLRRCLITSASSRRRLSRVRPTACTSTPAREKGGTGSGNAVEFGQLWWGYTDAKPVPCFLVGVCGLWLRRHSLLLGWPALSPCAWHATGTTPDSHPCRTSCCCCCCSCCNAHRLTGAGTARRLGKPHRRLSRLTVWAVRRTTTTCWAYSPCRQQTHPALTAVHPRLFHR